MARYVYDSDLVNSAIDELNSSTTLLNGINNAITNGINVIYTAQGGEYIKIDTSSLMSFAPESQKIIGDLITSIKDKAQQIEEYNNSSWFTKAAATIGMGVTKLFEGVGWGVEVFTDGFASLTGLVVGVVSEDAKNSIGEYVKKDHVGDAFAKSYESGFLSGIEKYSAMSSTSVGANIFKGIGIALSYAGIAMAGGAAFGAIGGATAGTGALAGATSGAASAATSIAVNAAIAGTAGLGAGTERGLQSGKSYNEAFAQGAKQGAIQAGTTAIVGVAANKISKFFSKPVSAASNTELAITSGTKGVSGLSSGTGLVGYSDDVLQQLGKGGVVADSKAIFAIKNSSTRVLADGSVVANPYFGMTDDAIVNVLKNNGVGVSDDVLNSINNATKTTAQTTSSAANAADDVIAQGHQVVYGVDGKPLLHMNSSNAKFGEKVYTATKNFGIGVSQKFAPITNAAKATAGAVGKAAKSVGNVAGPILKESGQAIANSPAAKAMIASNVAVATGYQVASNLNEKNANLYTPSTDLQEITPNNSGVVFNPNGTIAPVDDTNSNNNDSSSVDSSANSTNQNGTSGDTNTSIASGTSGINGNNQNVISDDTDPSNISGANVDKQNVTSADVSENNANGVETEIEINDDSVSNVSSEGIKDKYNDSNSIVDSYNDNSVSSVTNNYDNRTINNITTGSSSGNNNYAADSNGNIVPPTSSSSSVSPVANQEVTTAQTTSTQPDTTPYTTSVGSTQTISASSNLGTTTSPVSGNNDVMSNTTNYDSISSNIDSTNRETGVIKFSDYTNETPPTEIPSETIATPGVPDVDIPTISTTSDVPITSKSNGSAIPTVLGVGAALAAGGVGVGAYIKHKKNNESDDDSDNEYGFSSGEWPEETTQSKTNLSDIDSGDKESNNGI